MQKYGLKTVDTVTKDMKALAYYAEKYDPALKDWLKGIEAGCERAGYKVSYEELVLITVFPSELWTRPVGPYPEETGVSNDAAPSEKEADTKEGACTSFAAKGGATKDGKPMIAINGGSSNEILDRVIVLAFPDEGPSYTSFGTIGRPHDQMGLNSAGFAWIMTANFSKKPPWGVMPEIPFHYLTQYCKSPTEAQKYIESIPRTGATGNFVMSDAAGNISVTETNAECCEVRVPGDLGEGGEFVVNANHFVGSNTQACRPGWEIPNSKYRYATCWEYVSAAAAKSEIDFNFVKKIFRSDDWYDPDTKTWHYNDPGSDNGFDLLTYTQSTIFCPADLTAYFLQGTASGIGIPAGATGEFVKVQLADSPSKVAANMGKAAYDFYKDARNVLRQELNSKCKHKSHLVARRIERWLDKAWLEYEKGMDRAAFAYKAEVQDAPLKEQMTMWSEALTHYARAQLYAQMISTLVGDIATAD
jgi:hypothetical protein